LEDEISGRVVEGLVGDRGSPGGWVDPGKFEGGKFFEEGGGSGVYGWVRVCSKEEVFMRKVVDPESMGGSG